jgi:Holliday junction resolvase RusA-like endonuclease
MATTDPITFDVPGDAVPKQSFRYGKNNHNHSDPRVTAWQSTVAWYARCAMHGQEPLTEPVAVYLDFYLRNRRRRDCDNLAKAMLDGFTDGGVLRDDSQVQELHIVKHFVKQTQGRVAVRVLPVSPSDMRERPGHVIADLREALTWKPA